MDKKNRDKFVAIGFAELKVRVKKNMNYHIITHKFLVYKVVFYGV